MFWSCGTTVFRRPAGSALCSRSLLQFPSPTRPTSIRTLLWSSRSGASWVFSIWNGCCRLGAELDIAVSSDLVPSACRSHPNSAIGSNPVRQLSSFAPAVNYDCAMARTLRRLPRADEVESPAFVQRPQQPSFFLVCHHFRPGAGPSVSDPYQVLDG